MQNETTENRPAYGTSALTGMLGGGGGGGGFTNHGSGGNYAQKRTVLDKLLDAARIAWGTS